MSLLLLEYQEKKSSPDVQAKLTTIQFSDDNLIWFFSIGTMYLNLQLEFDV